VGRAWNQWEQRRHGLHETGGKAESDERGINGISTPRDVLKRGIEKENSIFRAWESTSSPQ
jgi:hypothetical protein